MPPEPEEKRVISFFDGQNLFRASKEAFDYSFPNYDPLGLSKEICRIKGWKFEKAFFYTGIPDIKEDFDRNRFWTAKLASMKNSGIEVFSRTLRYRNRTFKCPKCGEISIRLGQEKGIDVRLALDIVRMARASLYDVALVFSQDQDLTEAVDEIKKISIAQQRWIKVAFAFPVSVGVTNRRGINGTDWIEIDKRLYDSCIDQRDYRHKRR